MSDFNRSNDPAYRPVDPRINDPRLNEQYVERPVVVEERGSGAGIAVGAIIVAALAFGGYYFYSHPAGDRMAANVPPPITAPSDTPAPSAAPAPSASPATPNAGSNRAPANTNTAPAQQ